MVRTIGFIHSFIHFNLGLQRRQNMENDWIHILKKTKYIVVYSHIYIHYCVRDFREFLCSPQVPPERSYDHCKLMCLREFSMLVRTGFPSACSPWLLSYLVLSEMSTFYLLFLTVASANPREQPCSPWPPGLIDFPLCALKGVHCHSAEVVASPGADGGWNV